MSRAERRGLVERETSALPVSRQCRLLAVSRASVYRRPAEISEEDCTNLSWTPKTRQLVKVEPCP